MANPVPRTEAGREWLNEEHPAGTKTLHTRHARDRMAAAILAIEAEARQQMKAETREQIFRDNGLIADPLAAASPAAPAVDRLDPERMEAALMGVWRRMQRGDMSAGGPNGLDMRHLWAAAVIEHFSSLQDTVDPVVSTGGER